MKKLLLLVCLIFVTNFSFLTTMFAQESFSNFQEKLKIGFVKNQGQILDFNRIQKKNIEYYLKFNDLTIYFQKDQMNFVLHSISGKNHFKGIPVFDSDSANTNLINIERLDLKFDNINPDVQIISENQEDLNIKYYCPEVAQEKLSSFKKITYKNIYKDIDLVWIIDDGILNYYFSINNNANTNDIKLSLIGAKSSYTENGKLTIESKLGKISFNNTLALITSNNQSLLNNNIITLKLNNANLQYNKSNSNNRLLSHYSQVEWSTFLGGSDYEMGGIIKVDNSANVLFGIGTYSTDFPIDTGTFQSKLNNYLDIAIIKFDSKGNLIWNTFIGGSKYDYIFGLAVNSENSIWISGATNSTDFPITKNAYQNTFQSDSSKNFIDGLLIKLSKDGQLLYSSYFGGKNDENIYEVATDNMDNAWFTGITNSSNFPAVGTQLKSKLENYDAFIIKVSKNDSVVYSSIFGGKLIDVGTGITIDNDNNVIICGQTNSTNFPVTPLSFQDSIRGDYDAFIVKLNQNCSILWATYFGGYSTDNVFNITSDYQNYIIISGYTKSTDLYTTNGCFQAKNGGGVDAYIAKFDPNGGLLWSTYYGGTGNEGMCTNGERQFGSVTVNSLAKIAITGYTYSNDLYTTNNAYQSNNKGGSDGYFAIFDRFGAIQYSSYFGGTDDDYAYFATYNNIDHILITGETDSKDFPIIGNSYQTKYSGKFDGFLINFITNCNVYSFDYPDFTSVNGLNLLGNAKTENNMIKLVNSTYYQNGTIWTNQKVPVNNGFYSEFSFRFANGNNNGWEDHSIPGADGLAFIIQNCNANYIGDHGYALGYHGLPNSLAIEFDVYANDSINVPHEVNDPNGNHVAIQSLGKKANSSYHGSPQTLAINKNIITIKSDSTLYYARIDYKESSRSLRVFLDTIHEFNTPVLTIDDIDLSSLLNLDNNTSAYMGISATTGNAFQDEYLVSWTTCLFTSDPLVSVNEQNNTNSSSEVIEAYPNPFSNIIKFKYNNSEIANGTVVIYDIYGREIEKIFDGILTQGENVFSWNAKNFEPGAYYCIIKSNNSKNVQKIIYMK